MDKASMRMSALDGTEGELGRGSACGKKLIGKRAFSQTFPPSSRSLDRSPIPPRPLDRPRRLGRNLCLARPKRIGVRGSDVDHHGDRPLLAHHPFLANDLVRRHDQLATPCNDRHFVR